MDSAMGKCVCGYMRTVTAHTILCIRAVWSEPSLSANSHWIQQNIYERKKKRNSKFKCEYLQK